MVVFFILLILFLLLFVRKDNATYTILVLLTFFTFFMQFLVGRTFEYKSYKTIFNTCFICLNIGLIIKPWSYANILIVENINVNFFAYFKKILYRFLFLNLFLNLLILILVLIYLPDIAAFKAESAYLNLYDQIPYFANVFRYAYTTQNAGYLAIPIFYYHLGNLEKKEAFYAFLFSSSSLLSGFAFYSRAQIFTYTLIFIIYFFLIKKTLPNFIQFKVLKFIRYSSVCIVVLFLSITYIRFSAMDYYGDRIPENSIVKDPIVYSLFDYASQSYSNGLYQLERFTPDKSLGGEQFFRDIYQILNFFKLVNWDVKESQELIDKAYDYDGGAFNGYTAPLVFNFGYILTFLISFSYFLATKIKLKNRAVIPLKSMFFLILLLFIPTVSIFYTGYAILLFPLILLGLCRFTFSIKSLFR
ncbi:O-antigen polymerase [Flavobacterium panacagri]|uniref:O-antigen polymerase n=1 Tax=Flavobacterium panacagri TaxID=3034146 RepID=UPI0025A56CAE|nr:O-antigen polymerase [Flavobacterium panacagri]